MPLILLSASQDTPDDFSTSEPGSADAITESTSDRDQIAEFDAENRIPNRPDASPPVRLNWQIMLGVGLLIAALVTAYAVFGPSRGDEGDTPDLLSLAATEAEGVVLSEQTEDLDEAEEYILGEFGWPIRVPILNNARLVGVGVDEIIDGVELPVLQYASEESQPITVYVYDYAFLDAAAGRVTLAPAVYSRLAEDDGVDTRRVGESYVILWRRRAVIYTAVTQEDPAPLVEGLRRSR